MRTPTLACVPEGPVAVPDAVRRLAGDDAVTPVWRNVLGGLTFRISGPAAGSGQEAERFVKWVTAGTSGLDLDGEAERLAWAGAYVTVPTVLERGRDATGTWLATRALPGRSAVDPVWVARPAAAARAVGAGLRALHDALPVADCPFTWGAAERSARLSAAGRRDLGEVPAIDRLVVCHGDACAPNTLIDDDGTWSGHVDLAALGIADRWADLAVASMSLGWNYGDGYEAEFFDAYGITPDAERIAFYRRLFQLD
ncbi:phosphotransferase [Isoptericola aurantiacus]|uniref:phosphotransferase n=1 Tax=Isoptericola aurantiacus TaxID=3377839 RepID=UPI00383BE4C1